LQGVPGEFAGQGIQGISGISGSQGTQGTQGIQGIQGTQGIQGPQGLQGNTGIQGDFGIQGFQGIQGGSGTQGIDGSQGLQGEFGPQGSQGLQGIQGIQGIDGSPGPIGPQGIQGTQGTAGFQGIQGTPGPVAGNNKQFIYNDNGTPAGATNFIYDKVNQRVGLGTDITTSLFTINGAIEFPDTTVKIGSGAGQSDDGTTNNNIFIGFRAGFLNSTGSDNTFLGRFAGSSNSTGLNNVYIGQSAARDNTIGEDNILIGRESGRFSTGKYNIFFGRRSGFVNVSDSNIFFGRYSGRYNTSGRTNLALGEYSGFGNVSGSKNIFIGAFSGQGTSASQKVIIGIGTGQVPSQRFDAPYPEKDKQLAIGFNEGNVSSYWLIGDENLNVGFGTTVPTSKLTVYGAVDVNQITSIGSSVAYTSTTNIVELHKVLSTSIYRSVEYTIQMSQDSKYHTTKVLAVHDNTTAYCSEYATIFTNDYLGDFSCNINSGYISLSVKPKSNLLAKYSINYTATKI
jgi:hypothetical protein